VCELFCSGIPPISSSSSCIVCWASGCVIVCGICVDTTWSIGAGCIVSGPITSSSGSSQGVPDCLLITVLASIMALVGQFGSEDLCGVSQDLHIIGRWGILDRLCKEGSCIDGFGSYVTLNRLHMLGFGLGIVLLDARKADNWCIV
jgi:hypothetical protein